jgi:hypothetical protein
MGNFAGKGNATGSDAVETRQDVVAKAGSSRAGARESGGNRWV